MNILGIWRRNSVYFYLTFFSAGTQGIITQLFVRNYYPDYKELLLPIILVTGSIAYVLGIWLSGKYLDLPINIIKIMLCLNFAGFFGVLIAKSMIFYIIFYALACFSCNFAYNFLDHYFINSSEQIEISTHVKSMLSYQMLAFMLAPLFFSISTGNIILLLSVITFIAIVSLTPIFRKEEKTDEHIVIDKKAIKGKIILSIEEKLFIFYTTLFMAIVAMAISMMVYILSEYYSFPNFAVKSGISLMIMSISAGLGILIVRSSSESDFNTDDKAFAYKNFRPRLQSTIILLTLSMTLLLLAKLFDSFIFVAAILAVLGFVNGLFLSSTRKFAGITSVRKNRPELLTVFNNLQSISSLLGYGICIVLSIIVRHLNINFYSFLMMIIIIALLIEQVLIFIWLHFNRRELKNK